MYNISGMVMPLLTSSGITIIQGQYGSVAPTQDKDKFQFQNNETSSLSDVNIKNDIYAHSTTITSDHLFHSVPNTRTRSQDNVNTNFENRYSTYDSSSYASGYWTDPLRDAERPMSFSNDAIAAVAGITKDYNFRSDLTSSVWKQFDGEQWGNKEIIGDVYEEKYSLYSLGVENLYGDKFATEKILTNENWSIYFDAFANNTKYGPENNPKISSNGRNIWFLEGNKGITASFYRDSSLGNSFLRINTNSVPMGNSDIIKKLSGSGGVDTTNFQFYEFGNASSQEEFVVDDICSQGVLSQSLSASFMLIPSHFYYTVYDKSVTQYMTPDKVFIKTVHSQSVPTDFYSNDGLCISVLVSVFNNVGVREKRIIPLLQYGTDGFLRIPVINRGQINSSLYNLDGATYSFSKIMKPNNVDYVSFDKNDIQHTFLYYDSAKEEYNVSVGENPTSFLGSFELPYLYDTTLKYNGVLSSWYNPDKPISIEGCIFSPSPFYPSTLSSSYDIYQISVVGVSSLMKRAQWQHGYSSSEYKHKINKNSVYKKTGVLKCLTNYTSGYNVCFSDQDGSRTFFNGYNANSAVDFIYEKYDTMKDFNMEMYQRKLENSGTAWCSYASQSLYY